MSLAVGFSGIIYGIHAFILLSSVYGKERFACLDIGLRKDKQIYQTMLIITTVGVAWSLLPGISLLGHLAGIIAGTLLFLI